MLDDARFILRSLRRRPTFALTAVVSLGLAMGANATVFSVVNALLFRPLPYAAPEGLVAIWPNHYVANREVEALRSRAHSYEQVAAFSPGWLMALSGVTTPRQLNAARVSGNFFGLLGVPPLIGRPFGMESEKPGQDDEAVLSYDLWQSSFAGDPAIVSRPIRLEGTSYTVVAVMPSGFRTFDPGTDLWTALPLDPKEPTWTGAMAAAYGRLRPGVSTQVATVELKGLVSAMRKEFDLAPAWAQGAVVIGLQESLVGGVRSTLLVLLCAVAFLLLVAVANVANLLLVRTEERRHDLAVRAALGASPRVLAGLVMGESLVLGVLGGAFGVGLAYLGVGLLRAILPADLPRRSEIAVDGAVLGVVAGLSLLTTLLFGLAPALRGSMAALGTRLRAGRPIAGGGERTRGTIVAVEVALALILTVGATLMGRTLVALHRVDSGMRSDHLLTLRLHPAGHDSAEALHAYWADVLARVEAVPGVASAATILHLPTSGRSWHADVTVDGRPLSPGQSPPRTAWQSVSPGYFGTAGVTVLRGRVFGAADGPGAPRVVAVNTVFAGQVFPGENPLGRRVGLARASGNEWATIVAVVGSVRHAGLDAAPKPEVYVPFAQRSVMANSLVVRTTLDPLVLAPTIRDRIASVDREVPISEVRTMDALYSASVLRQRMVLILLGIFAGMSLLLSAIGIYGVVAYAVRQRLREIGVRVALGAGPWSIRRLVVGQGLGYATLGVAVGVPSALGLAHLMRGLVFGIPTTDPLSFTIVPVALVSIATAASWLPARKAASTDPTALLRE